MLLAIALAVPGTVLAAPPGVNLRWDHCYGDGGVQAREFACDTNSGSERLVASFELASDLPVVTLFELYVTVGWLDNQLPAWWQFRNAGSCRATALGVVSTPPAGSVSCADWGGGNAGGGIFGYFVNFYSGAPYNIANALIAGSEFLPSSLPASLFSGHEYFAFSLTIDHSKTTGIGACAGCLEPASIVFTTLRFKFSDNTDLDLTQGANGDGSQWVSWQHGCPQNIVRSCHTICGVPGCCDLPTSLFNVVSCGATAARPSTWGAVKALYR